MAEIKEPIRLNLGSGDTKFHDFISVDKYDPVADVQADLADLPFENNSVAEIKCYQVIEHIPYHQTQKVLDEMWRVLIPGGFAHIECPDLVYAAVDIVLTGDLSQKWLQHIYGEYHRPWDIERYGEDAVFHPGSIHYQGWTLKKFKRICEPMGFIVEEAKEKEMDVPETLSVILRKPNE